MLTEYGRLFTHMDKGLYAGVVFFYLKKAFDTVDHTILVKKLSNLGISGVELDFFNSYLSDRKQCCSINGYTSSFQFVRSRYLG